MDKILKRAVSLAIAGNDGVPRTSGHWICEPCQQRLCSTCKIVFFCSKIKMLNQELERITPKLCKFSENGCDSFSIGEMHELSCEFRHIKCKIGFDRCQWFGSINNFESHVQDRHRSFYTTYAINRPKKLTYQNFKESWQTVHILQVIDNNMFILFAHKDYQGRFIQVIKHIPVGKSNGNVYYFNISFGKQEIIFKHSIRAKVYDEKEQLSDCAQSMAVPIEELEAFLHPDTGDLEVTFQVNKFTKKN